MSSGVISRTLFNNNKQMMNGQKFCLKWDHFRTSVTSVFNNLRQDEELVDITLCCEGHRIKAHRMMLSACSPYFRELLKENPCQHPVFFLKDTSAEDLRAVIEFVYNGEVNVAQTQLASFIKTAEMLQIRGLSGEDEDASSVPVSSGGPAADRRPPPSERPRSPPAKRRRRSGSPPEAAGRPAATAAVPPPPPPPPPPPAPLSREPPQPLHTPPQSQQLGELATAEQPRLPPQSPADIKVEKVDLTEPEDDPSLEAALGRVVSYEGADGGELSALTTDDPLGEAGPSAGLAADRSAQGHWPMVAAGLGSLPLTLPSRSLPSGVGALACDRCGRTYSSRDSLRHHLETHEGKTLCSHCGKRFATISSRNHHVRSVHAEAPPSVYDARH